VLQYYMPAAQRDLVEQVCVTSSPINPASFPVLKMVLQYFFEISRRQELSIEAESKKFDANAPKIKFYRPKKDKAQKAEAAVEAGQPKPKPSISASSPTCRRCVSCAPISPDDQLEHAWGIYHALIARADFRKRKRRRRHERAQQAGDRRAPGRGCRLCPDGRSQAARRIRDDLPLMPIPSAEGRT